MRLKWFPVLIGSLLACAVALGAEPIKAYKGKHPLDDTAVLVVDVLHTEFLGSAILEADGKRMGNAFVTGTPWVRVLPGKHVFIVKWTRKSRPGEKGDIQYADVKVEVPDMKPRHVYVTRYLEADGKLHVGIDDLGENAKFTPELTPTF